ncbi:MAG: yqeH [Haloplasmataceae bacterium]|jgi:ribosome biogenesis GTPase YqeH|nr:yqeH [Haloplasmataceae bacterium]
MDEIKCIGCGSLLQTEHENAVGYVTKSALEKQDPNLLCKRCFRLKHYNEIADVDLTNDDFVKILNGIAKEDALIVKVVDLFDISGSMISGLSRFIGNNEVILVANKRDILPKAVKEYNIIRWVRTIINEYGLKVLDVVLTSSNKGHGIDELLQVIETHRKNRNVYVVGCTNVGKSTLINAIIKRFTEETKDVVTVSQYPGTTLGLIEIPIDDHAFIIDTPGIINPHQYAHYLDKNNLAHILPKKEIKPMIFQLESKQTLFFDGLARFDFLFGEKTSVVCFFNNEIHIHRTKLENAFDLFNNHIGELLNPPSQEEYAKMGEFRKHSFKLPDYKVDIVISGLGYITLDQMNMQIAIHAPINVGVFIRRSLL